MRSNTLLLARAPIPVTRIGKLLGISPILNFSYLRRLNCTKANPDLSPPDVPSLAQTARISLAPQEVEEFAPKIRQVVDWFDQLQAVELFSVEAALRADTEGGDARADVAETFDNRDAIIAAVPSYEDPYIKVPKVLTKE